MSHQSMHQAIVMESIGYRCDICGELFRKPHLLRFHERKLHGILRPEVVEAPAVPVAPSITTVVIPAIQTAAMSVARARGEIPFAVLHMVNEIPLIVRVLEQGEFSILKAAENGDFREAQRGGSSDCAPPKPQEPNSYNIAVVATIYQKIDDQGQTFFTITGPVCGGNLAENVPPPLPEQQEQSQHERTEGVMQDSLSSANLYKTLTQLNVTQEKKPQRVRQVLRPSEVLVPVPVPSTSGINRLKRKTMVKTSQPQHQHQHQQPSQQQHILQQRQRQHPVPPPPLNAFAAAKRPRPLQPKVITVVDNPSNNKAVVITTADNSSRQGVNKRSFQDVVTGSLLSPVRSSGSSGSNNSIRKQPENEIIIVDDDQDEDPFADIDMLDLIRTGSDDDEDGLLSTTMTLADMDIDGSGGDGLFVSIV